jgi:hypothetical protein
MRLITFSFLLAGAGLAVASPFNLRISTTELSAIRVGHAAANTGSAVGPDTKPTKMRHICKNMQKAVQNTASRLLAIIGISGPSQSDITPVPEGFSRVQIIHHKFIVPAAFVIKAGDSQASSHPNVAVMHKDGHPRGPFLHRVHRALISLGPWEGRIVAFVLGCGIGVLLRMFWVLTVLLARSIRNTPEHEEETIFVFSEEVAPPYREIEEKPSDATNVGEN